MKLIIWGSIAVSLVLKFLYLFDGDATFVGTDAYLFSASAISLTENGTLALPEVSEIAHFDQEYFIAGRLFVYLQSLFFSFFGFSIYNARLLQFILYL
ncbi:MAG: hypothetical protein HY606_05365, partial [Planctomycetes bacterium]|nr:hypothetical protein [Planctomycetota bacterium]